MVKAELVPETPINSELALLIYTGVETKGPIDPALWEVFYAKISSAIEEKECDLIAECGDSDEYDPQTINISSLGHNSNYGYIIPEDSVSQAIIMELVAGVTTDSGLRFKAWPVREKAARLWFKVPSALASTVDPSRLFKTLPVKNGWPRGQCTYVSCEKDPRDPKWKVVGFMATEHLVNVIKQSPEIKFSVTTTYVCHGKAVLSHNLPIMFEYNI